MPGPSSTNVVDAVGDEAADDVFPAHRRRHLPDERLDRVPAPCVSAPRRRWRRPGIAGSCDASARSSGARRSSAGFISAQWNGALTASGITRLAPSALARSPARATACGVAGNHDLSGSIEVRRARRPVRRPPRRRPCATPVGVEPQNGRHRALRRPAPLPACIARAASPCAAHPRRIAYRPRRAPNTRRGCAPRRTRGCDAARDSPAARPRCSSRGSPAACSRSASAGRRVPRSRAC